MPHFRFAALLATPTLLILAGCVTVQPGTPAKRVGDEIIVAGQLFHTGTRVVTWMDPGGYDAYRVDRRFSPYAESSWEKTPDAAKNLGTPTVTGSARRRSPLLKSSACAAAAGTCRCSSA